MRLPGFTAEKSVHRGHVFFRTARPGGARADARVLAQLRVIGDPVGTCMSWCFLNGGTPLQCFFHRRAAAASSMTGLLLPLAGPETDQDASAKSTTQLSADNQPQSRTKCDEQGSC
jgi:hypothetical protein